MARVCNRHSFILSENLCGRCGQEFCRECLVFPRGQRLPLCVDCAVAKSGVRTGRDPGLSKREIRTLVKTRRAELAEQASPPLPEIANPVPAGWAREDDEGPDPAPGKGRRRYRDADRRAAPGRAERDRPSISEPTERADGTSPNVQAKVTRPAEPPAPRRGRAARRAAPDTTREETADMMSFLDSMYKD